MVLLAKVEVSRLLQQRVGLSARCCGCKTHRIIISFFPLFWRWNEHDACKMHHHHHKLLPLSLLALQERQADVVRYAGLPSGDHSLVVEGLGRFAPTGSYAHGGNQRGLGDEEEEEVRHRTPQNFRFIFVLYEERLRRIP